MDTPMLPTSITVDKPANMLIIQWNDSHLSRMPFGLVRAACPCAECRGGHENMRSEPDPDVFTIRLPQTPATQIRNLEAVGSYALTIEWEDGHHFGIYNWRYLRLLCPCGKCRDLNNKKAGA